MDLREFLKSRFDKDKFIEFLSQRFYDFEAKIAGDEFLGSVKLDDRREIGFFIHRVSDDKDIENARVSYNDKLRQYAKDYMLDGAIGAFYNSKDAWRLSFVRFSYDDNNKQQVNNLKKFTFVLGVPAINTAYNQLKELKYPNIKAIEDAFGVEKVSNEFFAKYRGLFERLNENISDQMALFGNEETMHAFSKKLLGRIVFLYFLQKKGWLGVPKDGQWGDGDRNFVSNLFKKNSEEFYAKKLSLLFFDTLNRQRLNDYSDIFDCRIPFLNGGLFDKNPAYDDRVFISDEIFGEIFETFDGYNFTIIEDSADESEVAIDPEMLGRVFENLLEENYRKGKGAFYTPREIVGYMCRQSIKEKLIQTFEPEWIDRLINKQETDNPYIRKHANEIKEAVLGLRVLDPAIGSGAFPMGMLQTMVEILSNIDKAADKAELKRSIIENSIYGVDIDSDAVEIAKLRFWLSLTVDEESPSPLPNLDFKIMQGNSLLETINGFSPIPPDIYSKTEQKPKDLFDLQEQTLLDEKLFDKLTKKIHKFYSDTTGVQKQSDKEEIKSLIRQIINEYLDAKKAEYAAREKDFMLSKESNKKKLADAMGNLTDNILTAERILTEMLKNNFQTKELFLYKLFFGEVLREGGFDIVIGNPPYIKEYTSKAAFDGTRELECYQGKMDLWYLFGCKGIELLKTNGILCFIATNNWTTNAGAKKFRNKIVQQSKILQLLDFGSYMIFDSASIQTMVMIFEKNTEPQEYKFDYRTIAVDKATIEDIERLLAKENGYEFVYIEPTINRLAYIDKPLTFSKSELESILNQIEAKANFSLDGNDEIAQGIVYPQDYVNKKSQNILGEKFSIGDGIFILSDDEKNTISFSAKELELIKPSYSTKELGRYSAIKQNSEWVIYTDSKFKNPDNIKDYPNIKKHLDKFQSVITSDNKPYGLHRARNEYFFKGEKIISLRKCSNRPAFTYTDFDCYVSATFYIIKSERINLKYLTAILNSRLIAFWLKNRGKMQGSNYQVDKEPLLAIPLIKIENTKPFEILVDYIIFAKANALDTEANFFESVIDVMVYGLYFEESMKKADCYVNDAVCRLVLPFAENFTDDEKTSLLKVVHMQLKDDTTISRALIFKNNIEEIRIIEGTADEKQ